jgi:outer membrane protein TolC
MLGAVTLGACATPRAADTTLPTAFETRDPAPAGALALDTWWTAYDDPELTALVEQALARNPDVRTARARLEEIRSQGAATVLQYAPRGDAVLSGRRTDTEQLSGTQFNIPGFSTSGVAEQASGAFNVSWELDSLARGAIALGAARAEIDRVRFAYEATRAQIAAATADAWFQARGLSIQLADARETARIQGELLALAERRVAEGLAAASDTDRVAGDLAQSRAQVEGLEAQLQAQLRAVLILTGRAVEPTANLNAAPQVGAAPPAPASLPSDLLQRRPDVRQAEAGIRSAVGQQRLAALEFFPSLVLSPGFGWSRTEQPGFTSETQNWSIGGSISQPILSIPRLLAQLKVQEAEGALVGLEADRRRVALLTDGEARAQRAYEAAKTRYARGLTDLSTTLSAEQAWRAVRAQLTAAQVQALRRSVQAMKALGGGWPAQAYAAR